MPNGAALHRAAKSDDFTVANPTQAEYLTVRLACCFVMSMCFLPLSTGRKQIVISVSYRSGSLSWPFTSESDEQHQTVQEPTKIHITTRSVLIQAEKRQRMSDGPAFDTVSITAPRSGERMVRFERPPCLACPRL